MELQPYNGWENKFTWLVHLHLSNEASVMYEITELVESELTDRLAGGLIERWVERMNFDWMANVAAGLPLLIWDMVGTALAHTDWIALVAIVRDAPQTNPNRFTTILSQVIQGSPYLQQHVEILTGSALNVYVCADAVSDWFRDQVEAWLEMAHTERVLSPIALLVFALLQGTYTLVAWEHVARAFRDDY